MHGLELHLWVAQHGSRDSNVGEIICVIITKTLTYEQIRRIPGLDAR